MKAYAVTDIGAKRQVNQDYVFASEQAVGNLTNLFIVADGMGGHNAGDFASSYAVSVVLDTIREDAELNPIKMIRKAMEAANRELLRQASRHEGMAGMGTTMVAATVVDHYAYVANVGDSRLYIINKDKMRQVTRDHSLVEEMVRMGQLTREEAMRHPDKNIITRALGASAKVDIDFFDLKLQPESILLLCSDGLTNMVAEPVIEQIVKETESLEEAAHKLIDLANANGGKDNIGIVLVRPDTKEVEVC